MASTQVPAPFMARTGKSGGAAGSAQSSRSTSASTHASEEVPLTSAANDSTVVSRPSINELPDYDYPVPFVIRNTFIDVPRPLSFEEFYAERKIHSCPVAPPPGLGSDLSHTDEEVASQLRRAMAQGGGMMASAAAAAAAASAAAAAATMCWLSKPSMQAPPSPPVPALAPTPMPPSAAPVLRLADALGGPELGSPQLPTAGSAGHRLGTCKPCAFFHTKGCGNGVECQFCHLCPPGEKKRRQKAKASMAGCAAPISL